jgi:ribose transport system permease protein
VVSGLLCGIGGVLLVATVGGFDPSTSPTYLLPALSATFLGTAVIRPGRFNPIGTMVAIYFLVTGIVGLSLLGFNGWVTDVFYGAALIIAVIVSTVARRRTLRV